MLNSFVIVQGEGDEGEDIWVATVLWLCRCSLKRDVEGMEQEFVQ